jgi:hypothetical protein
VNERNENINEKNKNLHELNESISELKEEIVMKVLKIFFFTNLIEIN